jgi:hypothetical protein
LNVIGRGDRHRFYEVDRMAMGCDAEIPSGIGDPAGYRRAMAAI